MTVDVAAELVIVKSVPTPDNAMDCGVPVALSLTVSAPVRLPEAVGANVTLMLQVDVGARLEEQLLLCAKFPVT